MQILWAGKQEKVKLGKTRTGEEMECCLDLARRMGCHELKLEVRMKVWWRNLESHLEVPQVITEGTALAGTHGRVM